MNREQYRLALLDERWKSLRLMILQRDEFKCTHCGIEGSKARLNVHHERYPEWGKMPWQVPMDWLSTLCEDCHNMLHMIKTAKRVKYMKRSKRTIIVTTKAEPKKKVANGIYDPDSRAFA